MKKIFAVLMVAMLLCGLFAGCNNSADEETLPATIPEATEPEEKEFLKNGIKFTLPGNFEDYSQAPAGQEYTFLYAGPYNGVYGTEDSKASLPESVKDLASYAAHQATALGGEAVQKDGIWTLTYEDLTKNEPQMFVCAFYEGQDCYWTVTAYCPSQCYEEDQEIMWGYVTAVTFENE